MISSVFVDRPRLAIVIAFVITIAGALAMLKIPVAQFPDIVPPQVRVTATYPGASAQAVEESVAQVIEGQVNGVERMIYMQSTSTGSGTINLTVTFEIGTNPDQNAINVNNRVQRALPLLPSEVQRQGVVVQKRSTSILQVLTMSSPGGETYAAVQVRMRDWYDSVTSDTVAVAHGGTARALMVALGIETPASAADLLIEQGAVYVFGDGGLQKYN